MKWIGQNIYDLISRFRDDVYLEGISSGTIASGGNLGLDSNNKIVKAEVSDGDITGVTAGTNLSGGGSSGDVTINLADASTSVKGAASFSSSNFSVSSGAVTIKSGGVDLTDEVTGVLPSANMDTDTAHLSGTQTFTGAKTFQLGATFQDNVFFESTGAAKPFVTIKTTANSTSGSTLQFEKDKGAAGADGDDIANIIWRADNAAQELTYFIKILGEVATAADTDEAGKLSFQVAASDGSTSNLRDTIVLTGSGANDIVDVSVGYGVTSTTTVNGVLNVSGASSTFDCDTVTFQSDNADDPKIVIQNNTNDAQGARLQMKKDRGAAPSDNDNIAEIDFFGEDDGQQQQQYGKILMKTDDVTDGQESGSMHFQVASHNGTLTRGLRLTGGSESGEVDIDVGAGTSSVTTVAGTLTMGSTATLDNSGNLLTNAATATNLVASTSTAVQLGTVELGHASDTTIARSASGVATIEGKTVVTRDKVIYIETSNFSDDINTDIHFIPFVTTSENTNFANVAIPMLAPADGKLLKAHFKANVDTNTSSNTVTFRLTKIADGDTWNSGNATVIGTKVVDGVAKENTCVADFQDLTTSGASGTNAFSATELIGVSMQNSQNLASTKYSVTLVFEFDFNSY